MVLKIKSRLVRIAILVVIVLAHVGPGAILAAQDTAFTRAMGWYPGLVTGYGVALTLTLIALALFCAQRLSQD